MNKIKALLVFVITIISFFAYAQQVKPGFKKVVVANFFAQIRPGRDTGLVVQKYLEINEKGQAHYTISLIEPAGYDTTYQLPDSLIAKLNKVFKKGRNLEANVVAHKLPDGSDYKGWLNFISFTDSEGGIHSFIDIKPYMSHDFNALIDAVTHKASAVTYNGVKIHYETLVRQILDCRNKCKYCPPIDDMAKNPPRVSSLEIADPGVKH